MKYSYSRSLPQDTKTHQQTDFTIIQGDTGSLPKLIKVAAKLQ
jgi:hypothetical protein